jgi:hypothetical protein
MAPLRLAFDSQVNAVVAPERRAKHDIAEALETLADPLLERLNA